MVSTRIVFDCAHSDHQTVAQWHSRAKALGLHWKTLAKNRARINGESRTLLANGRVLRFISDGPECPLRQKTYKAENVTVDNM